MVEQHHFCARLMTRSNRSRRWHRRPCQSVHGSEPAGSMNTLIENSSPKVEITVAGARNPRGVCGGRFNSLRVSAVPAPLWQRARVQAAGFRRCRPRTRSLEEGMAFDV